MAPPPSSLLNLVIAIVIAYVIAFVIAIVIAFVMAFVIAFVIQTLDHINFTIASTLTSDCLFTVRIIRNRYHSTSKSKSNFLEITGVMFLVAPIHQHARKGAWLKFGSCLQTLVFEWKNRFLFPAFFLRFLGIFSRREGLLYPSKKEPAGEKINKLDFSFLSS